MERMPKHRREVTEQDELTEAKDFMRDRFGARPARSMDCFGVEHETPINDGRLREAYSDMVTAYGGAIANNALINFQDQPSIIVN